MGRKTKFSWEKRQKELLRQKKRKEKLERRAAKKEDRGEDGEIEDPDLAGIVPGPQQVSPWEHATAPPDEDEDEDEGEDGEGEEPEGE